MTAAQQQRRARERFKSSRSSPAHVNVPWGDTATQSTPSRRVVHGSGRCRFFGQQDTYGKGCALGDVARLAAGTSTQPPCLHLPRTTGSTEAARTLPNSCLRHGFACYTSLFSFVQLRHDHLDPDFRLPSLFSPAAAHLSSPQTDDILALLPLSGWVAIIFRPLSDAAQEPRHSR
ncbi:hypothetical protein BC567DRAFT_221364 [Phyllosticta citribraziliensis]